MNWQVFLRIFSFLNAWHLVFSVAQGGGQDYIVTDIRQIANLNSNEKATLGQIISSLGGRDVEITIVEDSTLKPQQNVYQTERNIYQHQYGYPSQGRPLIGNNSPRIDIIDVYANQPPSANYYNLRGPTNYGTLPQRFPSQPPSFDGKNYLRNHSPELHHRYHHNHNNHYHKHNKYRNNNNSGRPSPPQPDFDEDDHRKETDYLKKNSGNTDFVYPEAPALNSSAHQHNINLSGSHESSKRNSDSDKHGSDPEDYNVAGYINDFPVIFLQKDEIRK